MTFVIAGVAIALISYLIGYAIGHRRGTLRGIENVYEALQVPDGYHITGVSYAKDNDKEINP